jgi:predicted ATPase
VVLSSASARPNKEPVQVKPYLREIGLKRESIENFTKYPFSIPAVAKLKTLKFHPDVTFFVGENGSGKSTLIEAIAVALGFNPEGGTKQSQFTTTRTHSDLHSHLRLVRNFKKPGDGYFLRAESFYNLATFMEATGYLRGYGGKSLHQQSHGESFMATLLHKLSGGGLYIMDEPEAALSPSRQMAALSAIHNLVQQESQFIIATHSPILLAYPRACIYQFDERGIRKVKYEDTEQYSVTRQFLNSYQQLLKILMEP